MIKYWLRDCLSAHNNLNDICYKEDLSKNVCELFPIFKGMNIYPYFSYQDGEPTSVTSVFPILSLIVEFPHSEKNKVDNWFFENTTFRYACFIEDIDSEISYMVCNIEDLEDYLYSDEVSFIKYTGTYPEKCKGDLHISINGVEYILSLEYITNGTPYDLYNVSVDKLPKEIQKHYKEIVDIIFTHIPNTCCGGCI